MIDLQNSHLRTLAVVEAQMARGIDTPTDYLLPFFQSVISSMTNQPYDVNLVLSEIENIYLIEIPVYMAESLTSKLIKLGYLEYDKNISTHICLGNKDFESSEDLDQSHFDLFEDKLISFAKEHDLEKPLASSNWQKALFKFFSNTEKTKLKANLKGKLISNPQEKDNWIISKFILNEQVLNSEVYILIKKIYAAYSIADTVASIHNIGHAEDWNQLNVVYDSTVLMRLLGTSGNFLQKATLEMHYLLVGLGCATYYFDHNLNEVHHNLDALAANYRNGGRIHRETAQAFENGEISIAKINLLKVEADKKLAILHITQLEVTTRASNIAAQINPKDLEDFLKTKINYRDNGEAAQVDADTIERILLLRGNKKQTEIPKSKYIFVTHNNSYAKYASAFCKTSCGYSDFHAPPIVTLGTLTRISWLASDKHTNKLDLTNELAINCFQASLPDDKWFRKFWSALEQNNPELLGTDDIYDSLYLLDIRQAAENVSMGSSVLLDQIDLPNIIQNVKNNAEKKELEHRKDIENLQNQIDMSHQNHEQEKVELNIQIRQAVENEDLKKQALLKRTLEDIESKSHAKIESLKEDHSSKTQAAILRTEQKIHDKVKSKARIKARKLSKIYTVIVAMFFACVFIASQLDKLPIFIAEYSLFITMTSISLAVIQVVGLFIPKFSLLFLGPKIEQKLIAVYEDRYTQLLK